MNESTLKEKEKTEYVLFVLEQNNLQCFRLNSRECWRLGCPDSEAIPDIPLLSPLANKHHGDFLFVDEQLFYVDRDRENGTLLNGKRIAMGLNQRANPVLLKNGDILQISSGVDDLQGVEMLISTEYGPEDTVEVRQIMETQRGPRFREYHKALNGWIIRESIGKGSGGRTQVFRIEKNNSGWKEENALKIVSIMDEYGTYSKLSSEEREAYQKELALQKGEAESELQAMYELRGIPTITGYFEHTFVEWQEEEHFGCDLLIRMELLQCLRGRDNRLIVGAEDAVEIGIAVCEALAECHKRNILHRDIKPNNIFRNRHGQFQLGDFGISRLVGMGKFASTGIYTEPYAAPEQLNGEPYTKLVDIYSLGLTLYEICNQGRLPFAESIFANKNAVSLRREKRELPPPCDADKALSDIILKACAYQPGKRWKSADAMLEALKATKGSPLLQPKKKRAFGVAFINKD